MHLPGVLKHLTIMLSSQSILYHSLSGFLIAKPALNESLLGFQPLGVGGGGVGGALKETGSAGVKHQALKPGGWIPIPGLSCTV